VVQAAWEKEIIEALAERLGVDAVADPRPEIIAGAAMSALRASIRRWVQSRGHEDLAAIVADALDTLGELPAAVA
jgi:hypothetical protein